MEFLKNYNAGKLTGYKTHGLVKYFKETKDLSDLVETLKYVSANKIPLVPFGGGTNILINGNYDGLFLSYRNDEIKELGTMGDAVILKAGASVTKEDLVNYCAKKGYSGLEFWAGIPGLNGGGVAMNCGAYKSETKDVVHEVELCSEQGLLRLAGDKMNWAYRSSGIPNGSVIVSCTFKLKKDNPIRVRAKCDEYIEDRKKKHPLEYPSCGSVFKNPDNSSKGAWELVKDAGLCGFRIGGAMVSDKHSNFIINYDNASSSDIVKLIEEVKAKVLETSGIRLHEEIKIY